MIEDLSDLSGSMNQLCNSKQFRSARKIDRPTETKGVKQQQDMEETALPGRPNEEKGLGASGNCQLLERSSQPTNTVPLLRITLCHFCVVGVIQRWCLRGSIPQLVVLVPDEDID